MPNRGSATNCAGRMNDLPENTVPYVRRAIENFQAGIPFEEFGWDRSGLAG